MSAVLTKWEMAEYLSHAAVLWACAGFVGQGCPEPSTVVCAVHVKLDTGADCEHTTPQLCPTKTQQHYFRDPQLS